jgi:hypothetical protein
MGFEFATLPKEVTSACDLEIRTQQRELNGALQKHLRGIDERRDRATCEGNFSDASFQTISRRIERDGTHILHDRTDECA